jgi:hypothetical protein
MAPLVFGVKPHEYAPHPLCTCRNIVATVGLGTSCRNALPSRKHTAYLTLTSWLLAWLTVVPFWYGSTLSIKFVPQRDLGYIIGSGFALSFPFAAVGCLSLAIRRLNLGKISAGSAAFALAAAGSICIPGLFIYGAIFGCSFSGYRSCV